MLTRRVFLATGASALTAPVVAKANDFGLIFVGASWCPICVQAAPVLLSWLQDKPHIPLLVASGDDQPLPFFAETIAASSHPIARQVRGFPTTLGYSNRTGGLTGQIEGFRSVAGYVNALDQLQSLS